MFFLNSDIDLKKIEKRFDSLMGAMLSDLDIARAAIKKALPDAAQNVFEFSTLKPVDTAFIDRRFKQSFADKVFEAETTDGKGYIGVLVEHQSTADKYMVLRLREYVCQIIRHHLGEGHEHYPVVLPIVIYNGKIKPYPYDTDFYAYFQNPPLAKQLMTAPHALVDLSVMPDEVLLEDKLTAYPFLLMKHIQLQNQWMPIMKQLVKHHVLRYLDSIDKGHIAEKLVYFTQVEAEILPEQRQEFISLIDAQSHDLGEKAMTLFEHAKEQGMQQGMQQGIESIAKNMLHAGEDEKKVQAYTGLPSNLLGKLKRS